VFIRTLNLQRGGNIMIEVGKQAPDFELASHLGGMKFTLNQFKGQKNVMLVFYPLNWTPT
jgi:peroxiredoxin